MFTEDIPLRNCKNSMGNNCRKEKRPQERYQININCYIFILHTMKESSTKGPKGTCYCHTKKEFMNESAFILIYCIYSKMYINNAYYERRK